MQNLTLADFEFGTSRNHSGGYNKLYTKLKAMKVGETLIVTAELGYNEARTPKHNKTNITSCIGKQEFEGYKWACGLPVNPETKALIFKCTESLIKGEDQKEGEVEVK